VSLVPTHTEATHCGVVQTVRVMVEAVADAQTATRFLRSRMSYPKSVSP
jgi:hypothetical protein